MRSRGVLKESYAADQQRSQRIILQSMVVQLYRSGAKAHSEIDVKIVFKRYNDNKSNKSRTRDAFWRSAGALVFESFIKWHNFMCPMFFCSNSAQKYHFSEIQLVCDRRTDGQMDRQMYRWMNRATA